MTWKTTLSKLIESKIVGLRPQFNTFSFILILIFFGSTSSLTGQTAVCDIIETKCPPSDLFEPCGNELVGDFLGNYITWEGPDYSLNCGDGNTYEYQISFDLPEGKEECWEFYKVQRVGTGTGILRLWNSDGNASGVAEVTSPSFYMDEVVEASMDIFAETGQNFKVDVYLEDSQGAKSDILASFNVTGNGALTPYTYSIDPAFFDGSGTFEANKIFRLYLEFSAIDGTSLNNQSYIEFMTINAGLFGSACAAEANFAVVSTHSPGDFFPVGTTTVTYTAICNGCVPTIEESCSFDVTVNPKPDAPLDSATEQPNCNTATGTITVTDSNSEWTYTISGPEGFTQSNQTGIFPGLAPGEYTLIVTNSDNCTSDPSPVIEIIEFIDNEDPTISCPSDVVVAADTGKCTASGVALGTPTGTDNCDPELIFTNNAPSLYPIGDTTVTWTATDDAGNEITCEQKVSVTDTEKPTIICPSDVVVMADTGECSASGVALGTPTGTDNCDADLTFTNNAPTTFDVGTTTVIWTATDDAGNKITCEQKVSVTDNENPTISCPADIAVDADSGKCTASGVALGTPTGTDNCDADLTFTNNAPTTFDVGTTTVIWTATDDAGNKITCEQKVSVTDTEKPTIICAANQNQSADAGLNTATVAVTPPATNDNCGVASVSNDFNGTADASGRFPLGITKIIWTVTDIHGNTDTCDQYITITDEEDPVINCSEHQTQTADADACNAFVQVNIPAATDNNLVVSVINDYNGTDDASGIYPVGTTTITWTVTDNDGNSSSCMQDITVTDDQDPIFDPFTNITQNVDQGICGAIVSFEAPTATDNCDGTVVTLNNGSLASGSEFPVGTTTVTYTATDVAGNTATLSFDVIVADNENPVISCPADVNQTTDAGESYAIVNFEDATATDNCEVTVEQTAGLTSGSEFPIGDSTVTFTATDASGNTTQCNFTVTITDQEPPTITCPANIDIDVDAGICGAVVSFETPIATDNSGLEVTVTQTAGPAPGEVFPVGITKVTYRATDTAGNFAECSFDVTVNDTEDPTFGSVTNINVNTDAGVCGAIVSFEAPTATDNCEGTVVTLNNGSMASGSEFPVGTTTVTYTATDAAGNTTELSFAVTVVDNQDPTIECPESIIVTNIVGQNYAIVTYTGITATDNCGVTVERTSGFASEEQFPIGTTIVTYVATDASGNTTECSFTVLVKGTPVAVEDAVSTDEDVSITIYVLDNDTDPDGDQLTIVSNTDPGNGTVTLNEDGTFTYAPNANYNGPDSFTYTLSDGNGGTDTATVTITVNPINDSPIANDDVATTDEDNAVTVSVLDNDSDIDGNNLILVSTTDPGNGSVVINEDGTITYTPDADFNGGDSFTYTVSDGNGGTAMATVTITVNPVDDQPDPPGIAEVVQPTCEIPTGTITVETIGGLTYSVNGIDYQESGIFNDLEPGTYTVTAQIGSGLTSEVTLVTLEEPVAQEIQTTTVNLCIEDSNFDLFNLLSGEYDGTGTWEGDSAEATAALDGSSIDPALLEVGNYSYSYILTGNCPATTSAQVRINDDCVVLACALDDIKKSISKAVTPNGDGFNDFFTIGVDLDCGFTFDVKIFNRWGAEIYSMRNYQNNWDGFSDKSFTSSSQLPSGTYYYIIEINGAGSLGPIQGYIYLGTK